MSKSIYDLELHEKKKISKNVDVVRVPGGWLYVINSRIVNVRYGIGKETKNYQTSTFVPFDNEFQKEAL